MREKIDAAFRLAMVEVIERARRTGTPVIVWEDGRVVERSPDEMAARLARIEEGRQGPGVAKD